MRRVHRDETGVFHEAFLCQLPLGYDPYTNDYRNIPADVLIEFSAFTSNLSEYEGRILFPVRDIFGDIVAIIGRQMNTKINPKYKVYPENANINPFPAIFLISQVPDLPDSHALGSLFSEGSEYPCIETCIPPFI